MRKDFHKSFSIYFSVFSQSDIFRISCSLKPLLSLQVLKSTNCEAIFPNKSFLRLSEACMKICSDSVLPTGNLICLQTDGNNFQTFDISKNFFNSSDFRRKNFWDLFFCLKILFFLA